MIKSQPLDLWKNKVKVDMINQVADELSSPFVQAQFDFHGKVVEGKKIQLLRWKQIVKASDSGLGESLGQLYVKEYFTPEAKERMQALVNNLQSVYKSRIEKLDWMSAESKGNAVAKLEAFAKKTGYPDK